MENFGVLSILPPIIAIVLAIKTRQVYLSLLTGIWLGYLIISNWDPLLGTLAAVEGLVNVFKGSGNTRTIIFSCLVGSLITLVQRSGGVQGFENRISEYLQKDDKGKSKNIIKIQLVTVFTGMLIFIETNISSLTTGTVYRPLYDKLKISREKLAFIVDSTSAPSSILIPFNAWGAFITGLLLSQGVENSFWTLINVIPYNIYPIVLIIMLFVLILTGKNFGPMKLAENRIKNTGELFNKGSKPMLSNEVTSIPAKSNIKIKSSNMLFPIGIMVLSMPFWLMYTGWINNIELSIWQKIVNSISNASGSASVLYSVLTSLIFSVIKFKFQKIFTIKESTELILKGISSLMPLALLMLFAFAIGDVCKELETGKFISEISKSWLSHSFLPVLVFITSAIIAFSTGTSWGTFAIMIAIVVPLSESIGANLLLTISACLGGGVFGDHCSPISDTTIVSSMASACDHIDHVKTQLPYALFAALISIIFYLVMGLIL